jgi:predicted negative regulator of RcsB-dependent stress response
MLPAGVGFDISVIIGLLFYLCKIFGHSNYNRYNAKKFMELTGSNLCLVLFFFLGIFSLKYFQDNVSQQIQARSPTAGTSRF